MSRIMKVAAAAAAITLLAACGGGGDDDSSDGGPDDVKVGVIPIVDTAPIWLGKEKGFFEEEDINLEIVTTTGGAAAVPGVVSGDFDFAFGNTVSLMVGAGQGLPLQFVTNGTSSAGVEPDFGAVLVPGDSPIQSPADLAGKTVSVNNLKNIGDTTIRAAIEQDGGDPEDVEFVEVPFPDAPAALAKKQVDAIWVLEPFMSAALADGARVVTFNYLDMSPKLDIAGYFTTKQYIAENENLVERFTRAMNKSLEYAGENDQEVRDIVGTYTKIDEPTRAKMVLPVFREDFDRASMEQLGAAAVEYGTLDDEPDLDALLP
ncbi:PhnD/SsuA/transferrin family substrate-binding protein [Mumia zhuanghuii]|uniref:ABC transporter substrate-binding protein n=2 Tax=Mumia TaxID=1546255 RepID=A0ABW1QMB6_9ACTN|nr:MULTISPECIES: ABC transporter substrate-binding protein [Mumia]KAA1424957.1 PhnD/SsuA/transferrin family substrate-binding protein [Mumia zhuanghuii]